MLEGARLDAAGLDEAVDLLLLEADDPPEAIGRELSFVDEAVQGPGSDAEATLADAWGRPPTDGEVTPYWQTLVDSNRNALADPSNPDLIYGGQTFALPTPPPPPPPPPGTPAPAPAQPGPQEP